MAGGLNVYGYAEGDPVGYSDPYGLSAEASGEEECPWCAVRLIRMARTARNARKAAQAARQAARAGDEVYEAAQAGGKHAGFLRNYANRPAAEIQRAVRSKRNVVERHEGYLRDPRSHVDDWDNLRPQHQESLLRHWKTEIQTAQEQIQILERISP